MRRARPGRVRGARAATSPRARRPREPQVVPRAGPFLLPFSFLSSPLPLARCRRHFPRFLLPLQSGGREGAAGAFLPPCKLQRDSRLPSPPRPPRPPPGRAAPATSSRARPGTPAGAGRRERRRRGSDRPELFPAAPPPPRPPARASVGPSAPRGRTPPGFPSAPRGCRDFSLCWMRTRAPRRRGAV